MKFLSREDTMSESSYIVQKIYADDFYISTKLVETIFTGFKNIGMSLNHVVNSIGTLICIVAYSAVDCTTCSCFIAE